VRVSDHDPVVLYLRDPAFATADLAASVQANQASVAPGETATFGVGVANGGPDAAAPARLALRVDAVGTAFSVVAPDGWTCFAPVADGTDGQRIDCATGALAAGGSAGFAVNVEAPAPGGRALELRASVDTSTTDSTPGNDLAQASVAITAPADLAVAVTPTAASVQVGSDAVFGIGVANADSVDADAAVLDLELSRAIAGVQVQAADGWSCDAPVVDADRTRVRCTAATVAGGTQAGFTLSAPTSDALGEGALQLSAAIAASTADPDATNNAATAVVTVEAVADLAASVQAPKSPLKATKQAVFGVGVANAGPDTARFAELVLTANVAPGAWLALDASGWTCGPAIASGTGSQRHCQRDALASGASSAVRVTLDPRNVFTGTLGLGARVSAVSTDPVAGNDAASASVKISGRVFTQ
jgi:hypothetical protein